MSVQEALVMLALVGLIQMVVIAIAIWLFSKIMEMSLGD